MLELFTRHGFFDLTIRASGDVEVDDHHTVEDVGLTLGQAFQSYAEKNRVYLYGFANTKLGTGHLNENGHRLIGEALARRFCEMQ